MNNRKLINKRSPLIAGVIGVVFTVLALQMAVVASAQTLLVGITNKTWSYFATTGGDPGVGWQNVGFDDSTWLSGRGLFGNDTGYPYPFVSTFNGPSTGGPNVSFYRTTFSWSGSPSGVVLTLTNYVDDGDVIYINGTEITRFNMPAGPADQNTFALTTFTEPIVRIHQIALDSMTNGNANPLINGNNVLAVSVHNNAASSSDTVFGLSAVATQSIAPCTDGVQPTNRTILVGRTTTFTVVETCAIPAASIQWYRNVGAGEELITGAAAASYTLSNAVPADAGSYYARLSNSKGTVDSHHAVLTVNPDMTAPVFISASVVGPGLNTFRLVTDEELCGDADPLSPGFCGTDFRSGFNWHIFQSDDLSVDLGVNIVTQINPTTYEFTTAFTRETTKQYRITVDEFGEVGDKYQNLVAPGTFAETLPQATFQQGDANGYAGTHDTEVRQNTPDDNTLGNRDFFNVDQSDNTIGGGTAGPVDGLIRFDNIFGNSPTQVPPGSAITGVKLVLSSSQANANGNPINMHRMLIPWDESTTTWNTVVNGVDADGVEASITPDVPLFDTALTVPFVITLDSATYPGMLATVQAWANGAPNYGWALLPTGTDGYRVDSSEAASVASHPLLIIDYRPATCSGAPVIVAQPPAAVSANELQSFSITAGVSNACNATFQWTKDGSDIGGANGSTYDVASARPADNGSYRLRVTSPGGTVTSSAAVVTVHPKTTHPHVTHVVSSPNGTTITVSFSEAVSTASAQNTANYTLTPAVIVSSAVLGANNTVTLTTAARSAGTSYSLRIANVTDVAQTPNAITPNPTIVPLTSASVVAGAEWNSTWLYNSNNLDSTAGAWKTTGYVPGADWGTGPALFGSETGAAGSPPAAPTTIGTPLTPNSVAPGDALVTTYFRKSITLPALAAGARYVMCHYADDGFIAYLDGTEIYRFGMPEGAVTFTNRSTGIPSGDATMRSFTFNATAGAHTLAVELHQAGTTTSDVLFGMEVHVVGGTSPSLSISHTAGGPVNLNWTADGSWRLRGAAGVTGPYLDVAIPATNPLGTFTLPSGSVTNRNFWLLDYVCPQ